MKITTARRVSQVFFLLLLVWLVIVSAPGEGWRQLRGWPVNLLMQLDPLLAAGTALTTACCTRGFYQARRDAGADVRLRAVLLRVGLPAGDVNHAVGTWGGTGAGGGAR